MGIFKVETNWLTLSLLPALTITALLVDCSIATSTFANPIVPNEGGTSSVVTTEGNHHRITGGRHSNDGNNLFHEFEQFNVPVDEVADFLVTPELNNILTLINDENISSIDGLIQVTGGDANLFLVNPAGIFFGQNAVLNIGGGLTVTTADQIGFGENYVNLFDNNNYASLLGTPSTFVFTARNPGAIINEGKLDLTAEQQLTIIGGTIINTGSLSTEDGIITIASVPGEQLVRISQEGNFINLDLATIDELPVLESGSTIPFDPLSLPDALTGGSVNHASSLMINSDGTVQLTTADSAVSIIPETTLMSGDITTVGETGGVITALGDRVGLVRANLDASGTNGGGMVRVGGGYQGQENIPNANRTFISADSSIAANALVEGVGGQVIVWADEATKFDGYISVQGGAQGGDGGFVEVSGLEFLDFHGQVDAAAANGQVGLLLLDPTDITIVAAGGSATGLDDVDEFFFDTDLGPGAATTIDASFLNAASSDIVLQATNNITFNADVNIATPGVGLTANANNDINVDANITTAGGDVTLTANFDSIDAGAVNVINNSINTQGGNLTLSGQGGSDVDNKGVLISNSLLDTSNGALTIIGTGGDSSTNQSRGVQIIQSTVRAGSGGLLVEGNGGGIGNADAGEGIIISDGATVETINGGNLTLRGFGNNLNSSLNSGVTILNNGAPIRIGTDGGDLLIEGTGGDGGSNFNDGIRITGADLGVNLETAGSGSLTLIGIGGNGTENNHGVNIESDATIFRVQDGDLSIIGTGGNASSNNNNGVQIVGNGTVVESTGTANILIDTTAISDTNSTSFLLGNNSQIDASGSGSIFVTATAPQSNALFSVLGEINTSNIFSLSASQDIVLGDIAFDVPLALNSTAGNVQTGNITTEGQDIRINAASSIFTETISTSGQTNSGDVLLQSENGGVFTEDIGTQNTLGNGGSVTVEALTEIQVNSINTSSLIGDAGDVFLDPIGDIQIASINTTAPNGIGGTVDITTGRFFRASGSFTDFNNVDASISTAGISGNGSITIRHGGSGFVPFTVGDASLNGTQFAITTDNDTILPTQAFFDTFTQGDIQIITDSQQEPIIDNVIDDLTSINDSTDIFIGLDPATEPAFVTVTYDNTDVIESVLRGVEDSFQQQYENYYQASLSPDVSGDNGENESTVIDAQNTIRRIEDTTGAKPAIIYAFFAPSDRIISEQARIEDIREDEAEPQSAYSHETLWTFKSEDSLSTLLAQLQRQEGCKGREDDQLFLVVITSKEEVISKHVPSATCEEVTETASSFREAIFEKSQNYLLPSQQLYGWLMNPLVRDLEQNDIDNLVFIMDQGLRATPLAALHNGKKFLIENYSLGLMPSLNLTDTRYQNIQDSLVLPAGMSNFPDQNLDNLPAVPFEIDSVINNWFGNSTPLLEEAATTNNIRNSRNVDPTGIVHLATHARFNRSSPDKSYIQLWDRKLRLSEVRKMGWHDPVLELLILSACETASDSYEAELGFAGFASQAGVKSTLASLWNVSDVGTAALMIEFYTQLQSIEVPIKAEALQEAQVAMLNGKVFIEADTLYWSDGDVPLPDSIQAVFHREETVPNLSHPFYWSGFTLVGSPW